jgi:hypothetical protein
MQLCNAKRLVVHLRLACQISTIAFGTFTMETVMSSLSNDLSNGVFHDEAQGVVWTRHAARNAAPSLFQMFALWLARVVERSDDTPFFGL